MKIFAKATIKFGGNFAVESCEKTEKFRVGVIGFRLKKKFKKFTKKLCNFYFCALKSTGNIPYIVLEISKFRIFKILKNIKFGQIDNYS